MPRVYKTNPPPACHPDRPYCARGLCRSCYRRQWYSDNKDAVDKKNREWVETHREVLRASYAKYRQRVRTLHGKKFLTQEDFRRQASLQDWRCAICGDQYTGTGSGRSLCVDHDHKTMEFRALLCLRCNAGLGNFRDRPDLLLRAIEYLEDSSALRPADLFSTPPS